MMFLLQIPHKISYIISFNFKKKMFKEIIYSFSLKYKLHNFIQLWYIRQKEENNVIPISLLISFVSGIENPVCVAKKLIEEQLNSKLSLGRIPPW